MITAEPPDLVAGLMSALETVIRDPQSTGEERKTALAVRVVVRFHTPDFPPAQWACQLCGEAGQTIDCTYPCDLLRVFANLYGVTPVKSRP